MTTYLTSPKEWLGFNRYMVECEYTRGEGNRVIFKSFNRYMVECEFRSQNKCLISDVVLIDTWWNVNPCKYGSI